MSVLLMIAQAAVPAATPAAEAQQGVIAYPASFFAEASPTTAYDMVTRLPGFTLDLGAQVRGLAGAGGNVLIDGEPPVSKNDKLDEILKRIPAGSVARIELIRGGAPGIDMQGRTVVANVVRKSAAGFRAAVSPSAYLIYDGRVLSGIRGEGQWRWPGGRAAEVSLVYGRGPNDQFGDGPRARYDANGAALIRSNVDADAGGLRNWLTGAFETPVAGGRLRVNGAYMLTNSSNESTDRISFPGGGKEYEYTTEDRLQAELGGRYTRNLSPRWSLEAVGFQQWNNNDTRARFEGAALRRDFELDRKTTESVGRLHVRFRQSPRLDWELGGEGALNRLDSITDFALNGAVVRLPAANVQVEERRGELFARGSLRPTPTLTLEAGVRQERSTVTSEGDVVLEKTLSFTKPRIAATWAPNDLNQWRFRVEREVSQLNFDDFVASSSLVNTGAIVAGNPDLAPQQAWVIEAAFERRFWASGAAVITLRHSKLTDVVDRAPIFGAGGAVADAPANIGEGDKDEVVVSLSLPLDRFGISTGQLKGQGTWRSSKVEDPTTGVDREISNLRPVEWEVHFSQDLPRWKSNWGVDITGGFRETFYRLSEIESKKVGAWVLLFGEYKPRPDLTVRVEASAANGARAVRRIREVYAGPRDRSPPAYTDVRRLNWERSILIRIRKTFGG